MNFGNNGVNSINQGIGNVFRVLAQAPLAKQQAQDAAELNAARIYAQNMSGQKNGAEADGLQMTNDNRRTIEDQIAANPKMLPAVQQMYRSFGLGGDTNIEHMAKASGEYQKQDAINSIQGGADPTGTGQAYAAVSGKAPFANAGADGYSLNTLTGENAVADRIMAGLSQKMAGGKAAASYGSANSSNASARKYNADADIDIEKLKSFKKNGELPGSGGSEGSLSSLITSTLKVPKLDEKGRQVRSPLTGALDYEVDNGALTNFYKWTDANGRKPTATSFAKWESEGRPSGNASDGIEAKSAAPTSQAKTMTPIGKKSAGSIRADYDAGKITREQAKKQLLGIGFQ